MNNIQIEITEINEKPIDRPIVCDDDKQIEKNRKMKEYFNKDRDKLNAYTRKCYRKMKENPERYEAYLDMRRLYNIEYRKNKKLKEQQKREQQEQNEEKSI